MNRKYNKTEKAIIATFSSNEYNFYDCSEHGLIANRKETDNGKCPYNCSGTLAAIENIVELEQRFKTELGFE